jgi:hypothetical protein
MPYPSLGEFADLLCQRIISPALPPKASYSIGICSAGVDLIPNLRASNLE